MWRLSTLSSQPQPSPSSKITTGLNYSSNLTQYQYSDCSLEMACGRNFQLSGVGSTADFEAGFLAVRPV